MKNPIKRTILTLSFVFSICMLASAQITPNEAVSQMRKGINLGNTMEPLTEAGWNNPRAEKYYFDMYKDAGFDIVRVPVRWDNYTGRTVPYAITKAWLDRVEQVVDWGLDKGLFIVLNAHHDDWIKNDYSSANKARFDSIWTQIAERFKNKSEKLIFEVLNEPHGLNKIQNDDMHRRIISIIRKTNPTRLIIFQGHDWGGSNELLTAEIPEDEYVIGSFHSYDPYLFGLEGQGTWGTQADYNSLDNKFKAVSDWSEKNNIPVFLGEFGSLKKCDYNSRMKHYRAYMELSQKYGFTPVAWDDGGDFRILERQQKYWNEVKDILISTTAKAPYPLLDVYQDSIVRILWTNKVTDHNSIIVQRKVGFETEYTNIATLNPEIDVFYDIKPDMAKYYSYRVIAHYNDSSDLFSQPIRIFFPEWEKRVQKPFHGTPHKIPGVIEAEDFDLGGEGLGYHDADARNITGIYRPDEGVEIYERNGDGYHVGNFLVGEWLAYSVHVETEAWYDISFHLASYFGGGTFRISVDTLNSEIITALPSNSLLTTQAVSTSMHLTPGNKIVRVTMLGTPIFNFDKMVFELETGTSALNEHLKAPFVAFQNNSGLLSIHLKPATNTEILNVYNISGSLVFSAVKPNQNIEIPAYKTPPGIYFVHGISNQKKYTQKVFIR